MKYGPLLVTLAIEACPVLFAIISSYVRNRDDAQDVLQNVCVRLVLEGERDRPRILDMRQFLIQVARYAAIDFLRRRRSARIKYVPLPEKFDMVDEQALVEGILEREQTEQAMERESDAHDKAVAELPEPQREALELRKKLGLTVKQIAERMGVSEREVKTYLAFANRRIARSLKKIN